MATGVVGFLFINAEESASLGGVLKDFGASGIFRLLCTGGGDLYAAYRCCIANF